MLEQSVRATNAVSMAMASMPKMLAEALATVRPAQVAAAAAAPNSVAPRDLRDRRVPDFWSDQPTAWFQILDAHLDTANPVLTEAQKFKLLLPLIHGPAVQKIVRLVKAPPADVYTKAKETLILHFERSDEELIAELYGLSSLGDRSAVDFLEYMRSLQPGEAETGLFKHIFVKALPKHVTGIVSHHQTLDEMAAAADVVLRAVPDTGVPLTTPVRDDPHVDAVRRDQLVGGLCFIHSRYGREAYSCALPDQCRMKNQTRPRRSHTPAGPQRPRSGNATAGRQ